MVVKLRNNKGDTLNKNGVVRKLNNEVISHIDRDYKTKSVKFLGTMVNDRLTWDDHVQYVCDKLRKIVYLISQVKNILPTAV